MRQFEIYRNPSTRSRGRIPYVVVLQSHLLTASHLTMVAPVLPQDGKSAFTEVSCLVRFQGDDHIALIAEMAPVETRTLGAPLDDLADHEDAIRRALDRLFTGF